MIPKTKYRIDTGDSGKGVAGFVAYILAKSEQEALEILRAKLRQDEYMVEDSEDFTVCVYLNAANVKIEEVEEEDGQEFLNKYRCEACNEEWEDTWDCACNDKCPRCNKEIEPFESIES